MILRYSHFISCEGLKNAFLCSFHDYQSNFRRKIACREIQNDPQPSSKCVDHSGWISRPIMAYRFQKCSSNKQEEIFIFVQNGFSSENQDKMLIGGNWCVCPLCPLKRHLLEKYFSDLISLFEIVILFYGGNERQKGKPKLFVISRKNVTFDCQKMPLKPGSSLS